jgi:hypothetical protein
MTLRSPDVEEQNRLIKQRRVVDSGKEDKVGMRFALWLRDEWGRADVGSMLENASKVGAEKWAVEYIKHHIDKGLRGDALKRVQSEIALAFRNRGGDERIWKTVRVNQMVQSGLRNNNEQRQYVKKQLAMEKYPWNFGVMVEILKQSGAMDGGSEFRAATRSDMGRWDGCMGQAGWEKRRLGLTPASILVGGDVETH